MAKEAKLNFGLNAFRLPDDENAVNDHTAIKHDDGKWLKSILIDEDLDSIEIDLSQYNS